MALKRFTCFPLLAAMSMLLFSGCGGGEPLPEGMPKLTPVTITVIQDGQGLEDASIALLPVDAANRFFAGARCDAKGIGVLRTHGKYPGVAPGKYKVVITKRYTDPSKIPSVDPEKDPAGYSKAMEDAAKEVLNSYDLIDPKFAAAKTTPEEIEVAGAKIDKTIDVGKAVKEKIAR